MSGGWSDHARRDLRVSLAGVDNATARSLLEEHRGIVTGLVQRFRPAMVGAFHVTSREDLVSVAEAAVLEAWVTYREGDVTKERREGAGFRTHVRRVVRWRLADHAGQARREAPDTTYRVDRKQYADDVWRSSEESRATIDPIEGIAGESPDPVEVTYLGQARDWLLGELGELDPRRRTIVVAVLLEGETQVAVARSLGLTKSRVCKIYHETLAELRQRAEEAGLDETLGGP